MSASSWDALISMIDPLIYEGYTVTIGAGEPEEDFTPYLVTVKDGDRIVATGKSGFLSDALAEAYVSTPEKGKR